MKKVFFLVLSIIAFTACEKQTLDYVECEIIVAFEETVTNNDVEETINEEFNLGIIKWLTDEADNKVVLVGVPQGEEANWVDIASQNDNVKYAELNRIVTND